MRLVTLGVLLHDVFKSKNDHYVIKPDGKIVRGNKDDHLLDIHRTLTEDKEELMLFLSEKEADDLTHMVGSHHGRKEWGCVEEPKTEEAKLLHQLDMISAHVLK